MKVKCKPRTLEAIKYDGSNGDDIVELLGSNVFVAKPLVINFFGDAVKVDVGHWIVVDDSRPQGFFIESPASFSLKYSIVEEWI